MLSMAQAALEAGHAVHRFNLRSCGGTEAPAPCVEALLKPANFLYHRRFVTAPEFGFRDAADYYAHQSSLRFLEAIRVPALLIQAQDDPMIPFDVFRHPAIAANPRIRLHATRHGGHVGFIARGPRRFWLDGAVLGWVAEVEGALARP